MKISVSSVLFALLLTTSALGQQPTIDPQIRIKPIGDSKITVVALTPHFVAAIRLPDPVNAVVVGDPALFRVEHSEHEPELVFVKALTTEPSESNLLISTTTGREISILLTSRGQAAGQSKVDFLLQYQNPGGFLIPPVAVPFSLVPETNSLDEHRRPAGTHAKSGAGNPSGTALPNSLPTAARPAAEVAPAAESLEGLLKRQKQSPLPVLYGEHMERGGRKGTRLRAGVSEVLDGGQQVIVLFSVVNTGRHAILLMPPQIQLAGRKRSGKLIKHERWSTAEQLAVIDSRLTKRRLAPGERADGVVMFERPPYKQSTETLLLQMAESGAVDKPSLAPIGFGVSTLEESGHDAR